jgi:hypothetical protein
MGPRTIALRFAVVASTMALLGGVMPSGVLAGSGSNSQSLCIGHHPMEYVWYTPSCTGQIRLWFAETLAVRGRPIHNVRTPRFG